ncbi:porin [Burkholderia gladioli]|nr:porin [Burkholderia gladioli]
MNDVISGGGAHSNGGQFGASVPIGAGRALASYAYTKMVGSMNTTRNTWSVGYDYNLSKRTDVYAAYLNDRITGLSSGNTFGVGIRTYF